MNKTNRTNQYGVKEVPDLYVCNENGDVLYYSDTLIRVDLYPTTNGPWRGFMETPIGNLEDWYSLPYDTEAKFFYFRTFKRNKDTGEDEPLCFVIPVEEVVPQGFYFKADGGPFTFPVVFIFKHEKLLFIRDEDCPKKEAKNFIIPPEKNYKQVKAELVRKTLMELKKIKRGKEEQNDN